MRRLDIVKGEKILVVAPHPDDESIGTGGLLLLFSNQIEILLTTDGAQCSGDLKHEQISQIRLSEFKKVMSITEIETYHMLMYPNGELIYHPECFNDIDFQRYSKVMIPYKKDQHSDHLAVCSYVLQRIEMCKSNRPQLFMYETKMSMEEANYYLDITDVIEDKLFLINQYQSQVKSYNYVEFSRALAKYWACKENQPTKYLEAYTLVEIGKTQVDIEFSNRLADFRRRNEYLEKWIEVSTSLRGFSKYLNNKWKKKNIVIYGFGSFGKWLYREFLKNGIKPKYVLDKNAKAFSKSEVDVRYPFENKGEVDIVIITNIVDIKRITEYLYSLKYKGVIALWDFLVEAENCVKKEDCI